MNTSQNNEKLIYYSKKQKITKLMKKESIAR